MRLRTDRPDEIMALIVGHEMVIKAVEYEQLAQPSSRQVLVGALWETPFGPAAKGDSWWEIEQDERGSVADALSVWRRCFLDPEFRRYWSVSEADGRTLASFADWPLREP